MDNYFELELSPTEFYFGQFDEQEGTFDGLGLYVNKGKHIYIGHFQKSNMHGIGSLLDLEECSLYLGQFQNSAKSGFGQLVKYRGSAELRPLLDSAYSCTKESFSALVNNWNQKAEEMADKAKRRSQKLQQVFTSLDLKDILKKTTLTPDQNSKKYNKHLQNTASRLYNMYLGEWANDKRHGWGSCIYQRGDKYQGSYQNDKMEGRGKYWFYSTTAPVTLFVGEVSDNTFQGLGKLVFRDGSQYYGSFVNNQMNSKKGVIYFNNGDKFKGQIERGQRNGPGELTSADSKYSFQGNFRDDLRDGSNCVFTIQTDQGLIKYLGEYQSDKRHGKCEELSLTDSKRQKQACFRGELDKNEELSGVGQIDLLKENVFYQGGFRDSQFFGKGTIVHTDSKCTFEGEFLDHHKHGDAKFILQSGFKFVGKFNFGNLQEGTANFGKRF